MKMVNKAVASQTNSTLLSVCFTVELSKLMDWRSI